MQEKFTVTQSAEPHQDQYAVMNQDASVCFGGFFGHHGPHKFAQGPVLYEALEDILNGWKYIRSTHGDLYGVGWDRAQEKAEAALKLARGEG